MTWRRDEDLHGVPVMGGFRAFVSPGDGDPPPRGLIERIGPAFDSLVLDASAISEERSDRHAVVCLLPPTDEGARRARRTLELMPALRWVFVANRLGPGGETTVGELERILGHRIALELPCTPALRDVEGERLLTSRIHRWVRRIEALARGLVA
jgi:hypothetical protein